MKQFALYLIPVLMLLMACTDGNSLGNTKQPDKDKLNTGTATFSLASKTIITDSILQRNPEAVLGEYTDARFGTTQADFMAQLYCPSGFSFPEVTDNEIDSVFLYLFYNEWFGDDNTLFETSVYLLEKGFDLQQAYYTNLNVDEYCPQHIKLGSATFTPVSAENEWTDVESYCVRVPLSTDFAQDLLEKYQQDASAFDGPVNFAKTFPGLYVTLSYGNGCMIYINDAQLEFCYNIKYLDKDSVLRDTTAASYFAMTKEVKQVNRYAHPDLEAYLAEIENDSLDFIYAPAGLFTEVKLPMQEVCSRLSGKDVKYHINYARLKVSATDIDDDAWALSPPEKLLLLREQDVHTFFGQYNKADDLNSFLAEYDDDAECYIFNLSNFVQKSIRHADGDLDSTQTFEPYDKMLILPVKEIVNDDKVSLYLLQDTRPSAMKLRSAANEHKPMKLELVYSTKNSMTL